MKLDQEINWYELYEQDPQAAQEKLLGLSQKQMSRGKFLSTSAIAAMGLVLGSQMVYGANYPSGLIPASLNSDESTPSIPGKSKELIVLNDKPWNAETPPHLLDPKVTPSNLMFVRNNGIPPSRIDANQWELTIEGESVERKKVFSLNDLKSKFKHYTLQLTLECGGNGRSEFNPSAKGNQWALGAVGCPEWTGVRLKDVLENVGVKSDAVYIGYYGADTHLSGADKVVISRGVPIEKALQDETLIAWAMNGKDIPLMNGAPLRLVVGGWPASTSGKWLTKIVIRNQVHDGPKMGGYSYRVPKNPVAPGTKVAEEDMRIIESMPVKSLITYPKTGAMVKKGQVVSVRGHAWAGDLSVQEVFVSIDFGASWKRCSLSKPINRFAWQQWNTKLTFPKKGYYEVWCKAIDSNGIAQPMLVPGWNPKGYLNNACHRIAIKRV